MKKITPIIVLTLALSGCATVKPIAKTVLEVAREACGFYASQTGFSFEDACATEKQLRPFIDALLAAQAAAAKPTGACPECAACSAPKPEPKLEVAPPAPTPVPIPTPAPEKK